MNLGVIWENSIKYSTSDMASMSLYTDRRKILLGTMTVTVAAILIVGITAYQTSIAQDSTDDSNGNPTDGFDIHVSVNKHDSEHLEAQMQHYCKLDTTIVAVCQLYAGNDTNAKLSQIEFIITDEQYQSLPAREKQNWHNHAVELTPQRGEPEIISLPAGVNGTQLLETLTQTYGKVITLWDPSDELPNYEPYVHMVDSPYALGYDQDDNLHCLLPAAGQPPCEETAGGGNATQTTTTSANATTNQTQNQTETQGENQADALTSLFE
jgi:hypothetical protein